MTLLPCPFCGFQPDRNDHDCVHPSTRPEYDPELYILVYRVWEINCYETGGGCSANILGSSPEDVIEKWNKRV